MKETAVAVFAKTPGVTPAKTRLAKSIGTELAEQFYLHCLEATGMLFWTNDYDMYWAINEDSQLNNPFWTGKPKICQGDGDLGEKMARVYSQLKTKYKKVILIGTDLPTLTGEDIKKAVALLDQNQICVGPSTDGGFYLFASKIDIKKEIWLEVPYSSEHTLNSLLDRFSKDVKISYLDTKTDVDEIEDLLKLKRELTNKNGPLAKISKLIASINLEK